MHGDPWAGANPTDARMNLDRESAVVTALDLSEASGAKPSPTPTPAPDTEKGGEEANGPFTAAWLWKEDHVYQIP